LQLPARQRAVLVLRYWEQLTDAETAALLGCAQGTVKSAGSRGLARLRELADEWADAPAMCGPNGK
jgi:RNA polymerase sigma factor (sigma-70 family)